MAEIIVHGHKLIPFTVAEEKAIVDDYEAGMLRYEVAKKHGVCGSTIDKVFRKHHVKVDPGNKRKAKTRVRTLDVEYFSSLNTEAKAYWCGFLCADGNITPNGTTRLRLAVVDKTHLEKLRQCLQSDAPLKYMYTRLSNGKTYEVVDVNFCSVRMARDLERHGVVSDGRTRTPPADMDSSLLRHWIRGIFDGDGSFSRPLDTYPKRHWTCSFSGTQPCSEAFRKFAEEHTGTTSRLYEHNKLIKCAVGGTPKTAKLCNAMYDGSTIYLERKYRIAQEIMAISVWLPRTYISNGKTHTVSEWNAILGFPLNLLRRRLGTGWSFERAISTPPGMPRRT